MPMMKICKCGKIIPIEKRRCSACDKRSSEMENNKMRHKRYDKFRRNKQSKALYNSKEWKMARAAAVSRDNYLCVHCLLDGHTVPAEEVDHIVPIKVNWGKRLSLDNLQSLCFKCHRAKTRADKLKYRELQS